MQKTQSIKATVPCMYRYWNNTYTTSLKKYINKQGLPYNPCAWWIIQNNFPITSSIPIIYTGYL